MKKFSTLSIILFLLCLLNVFLVAAHEENLAVKEMKPMPDETHHLEVKPESLEGYRIPYMSVTVTIIDQETQEKKTIEMHPMFGGNFHYGINVGLKPKQYLLRFHLDSPTFTRGDERESQWLEPVDVDFTFDASAKFEKSIKIGGKETKDMKISFEAEHAEPMFILEGTEQEHTVMGHQAVSTQTQPTQSLARNATTIILYGIFLVVGTILGFIVSLFVKSSSKK